MRPRTSVSTVVALLLAVVLLIPQVAMAAPAPVQVVLDFTSGSLADWLGKTLGLARSLLLLMLLVGIAAEAFGKPAGQGDFAGVARRFVLVFAFLVPLPSGETAYVRVMGWVMDSFYGVASSWGSAAAWTRLGEAVDAFWTAKVDWNVGEVKASNGLADMAMSVIGLQVDGTGGLLLSSAVTLLVALGQASLSVLNAASRVLAGVLFILGPLPIVASIPAGVGGFGRWMRTFVSVLLWPLLSALMVDILVTFAIKTLTPHTSYESAYQSLAVAGLMMLVAFAVPVLASSLTGASMGAIGAGWSAMAQWGNLGVSMASKGVGAVTPRGLVTPGSLSAAPPAPQGAGGAAPPAAIGGVIPSAGAVGGQLPNGGAPPAWAKAPLQAGIPRAAAVSPVADVAMGGDVRGGVAAPPPLPMDAPTERPVRADWAQGGIAPAQAAPPAYSAPRGPVEPPVAPVEMRGPALDGVGLQRLRLGDAEGLGKPPQPPPLPPPPAVSPVGPAEAAARRPAAPAALQAAREAPTNKMPWVSDEAFANWRRAHPGGDYAAPEARAQLLEAQRAVEAKASPGVVEAPTPVAPPDYRLAAGRGGRVPRGGAGPRQGEKS